MNKKKKVMTSGDPLTHSIIGCAMNVHMLKYVSLSGSGNGCTHGYIPNPEGVAYVRHGRNPCLYRWKS